MRVKPDFRVRKYVGKQVRVNLVRGDSSRISLVGELYRQNVNLRCGQYGLHCKNGVEYCFFNAIEVVRCTPGFEGGKPTFTVKF